MDGGAGHEGWAWVVEGLVVVCVYGLCVLWSGVYMECVSGVCVCVECLCMECVRVEYRTSITAL